MKENLNPDIVQIALNLGVVKALTGLNVVIYEPLYYHDRQEKQIDRMH